MHDRGTGYGRPRPTSMRELTEVGPGTPRADAPALVSGPGALRARLPYMGPPERKAVRPRYEVLERLEPGESLEADDRSSGGGGPTTIPCNWLQHYENLMDTLHVPILHGSFSGPQFTAPVGLMPEVTWEITNKGVEAVSDSRPRDQAGAIEEAPRLC